jgi:adenine deaminase
MTDEPPELARKKMEELIAEMKELGCEKALNILPFLSLLVIPEIKISDKGLFDVGRQKFIPSIKS